jgi:predicted TIM-barrel fold metal-dependent hydrolase
LLALSPATKILYGSDGHTHPEMFWLGARYARWALGEVLGRWVGDGTLGKQDALDIAERICYRNALEIYRLDPSWMKGNGGGSGTPVSPS